MRTDRFPRTGVPRIGVPRIAALILAAGVVVVIALVAGGCEDDSSSGRDAPAGESASGLPEGDDARIERVVDGDTVVLTDDTRVRLIGVDTPETVHPSKPVECFGREASAFMGDLLPTGTDVRLVYDVERTDRYDRTLAYVYRLDDGLFVNAELLAQGYAQIATYPPNVAHVDEYRELQAQARDEQRGLWNACDPDLPPPG
ncbi:MAG: thermonuclease family protein [Acidimicrobiia bacterium]|nr:thermonuclease family protein [Acidimicrobiia bacterium]